MFWHIHAVLPTHLDATDPDPKVLLHDRELWEVDRAERYDLPVLNKAFHDAVPVLAAMDWRILRVDRGFAETVAPLNVLSTNQFVTHQAAMILVAADYAGGVALSTLFHRTPILGFHSLKSDDAAYLWGARSSSQWLLPSTDDL